MIIYRRVSMHGHKFLTWMIWVPPWEGHPSILVNLCKSWLHHLNMTVVLTLKMTTRLPMRHLLQILHSSFFQCEARYTLQLSMRLSRGEFLDPSPCGTLEPWGRGRSHSARGPAGHESLASLAAKPRRRNWCFPWPVPLGMKHVSDCVFPGWGLDAFKFIGVANPNCTPSGFRIHCSLHCATPAKK